ncbi:sigma-54 dependent transcriptional regulator [Maridesulfovibrio sp.]|uniref:sigma-54 dependent transcriptional regulator n=1 Tax=Maridesulfovibrio sp. TaxID=2795000 RepID=UPI002A18B93D|nr:sigma-54 dependent transcriptional regulator [Maridesulfovibrio sp.]
MSEHSATSNSNSRRSFPVFNLWNSTGLRGRLLISLLPTILIIILVVGTASYKVSKNYIRIALGRTVSMQNLAMVHDIELFMKNCATDLRFFARETPDKKNLEQLFQDRLDAGGTPYLELAYLPAASGSPLIFLVKKGRVVCLDDESIRKIQPAPLLELDKMSTLKTGEVQPSYIREITYPQLDDNAPNLLKKIKVIRFYIRTVDSKGAPSGIMMLSIKAEKLRNYLSIYDSKDSPLWSFPRSNELRFSYFVDPNGWILFQSTPKSEESPELTTFLARQGFQGTLGKADHDIAFRPSEIHADYWEKIDKIKKGEKGLEFLYHNADSKSSSIPTLAYAPVMFKSRADTPGTLYGGIIYTDRSVLPKIAGYDFLNIMLVVSGIALAATVLVVLFFGRALTRPIREFAAVVGRQTSLDQLKEIDLPYRDYDLQVLQKALNRIIRHVNSQVVQIQAKDKALVAINSQERADLSRETRALEQLEDAIIPEIIGFGKQIEELKTEILKAAGVDVDVLIYGETGTGKQLVAEAVHNSSERREKPFISINCGALDENLLLDALFGHVKGAFSDARTDRKGAFIEADGGTLFLDEIQSASLKVQQSLLRAIASRRIKPLGSDSETPFNIRIIVATNADLPTLIKEKQFREDLYYRLKVVMIETPALRDHPDSIPLLSLYYMKQAENLTGKSGMELSRGAVAKLNSYNWPGNVRELVNSITRAVVMANGKVIQADEIRLEADSAAPLQQLDIAEQPESEVEPNGQKSEAEKIEDIGETGEPAAPAEELNDRQKKAWAIIRSRETVTRTEYQKIVGGKLPSRTAIYDLQALVKAGKLCKKGRGPSTRYEVVS